MADEVSTFSHIVLSLLSSDDRQGSLEEQASGLSIEDWRGVQRLAQSHGILPVIYRAMQREVNAVPDPVRDYFRNVYYETIAANLVQLRELSELQSIFEEHGIPTISFKGAALAHDAYGDIGFRRSVDLDILIPEAAFDTVNELMLVRGYKTFTQVRELSRFGRAVKRRIAQQVPFRRTDPHVNVDVHLRIMPPGYSYTCKFDELWVRSRPMEIQGTSVRTFSPEDLLLILCFHGVKNRWESLKYGCDVAHLIRSKPDMDWDALFRRAEDMQASRILNIGLLIASRLFHSPLLADISRRASSDRGAIRAFQRVHSDLLQDRVEPLTYAERFRFNLSVHESYLSKAKYCLYAFVRRLSLESI